MPLVKCKECDKEVSKSAAACPHCGAKDPATKPVHLLSGLAVLIAAAVIATQCANSASEDPSAKLADAECRQDLKCWGNKHVNTAGVYCAEPVAKLGGFRARWTDATLEPKFSQMRWLDKNLGTLTFVGDKIEFENGFGAYQTQTYECDFQPGTNAVLAVRSKAGRI